MLVFQTHEIRAPINARSDKLIVLNCRALYSRTLQGKTYRKEIALGL